jgi:2-polyprenyl-3-methyl-5-hydroxy-6-metoxy-1,4-benzoquinol methylase
MNMISHSEGITSQLKKHVDHFAHSTKHSNLEGLKEILKLSDPKKDDTVLDVACGEGIVAFEYASLVKHVTGIDWNPNMIEQAKISQKEKKLENIKWKIRDASKLTFQDDEFSIVVTRYSIHHMVDSSKVLEEMYRVCKPGGKIIVVDVTPNKDKKEDYNLVEKLLDTSHIEALALEELKEMMHNLGLINLHVEHFDMKLDLEMRLQSSYAKSEDGKKILQLYEQDLTEENLGMNSHLVNGQINLIIPVSIIVGSKSK